MSTSTDRTPQVLHSSESGRQHSCDLPGRNHLIGTWDLMAAEPSPTGGGSTLPEPFGLMTCAADGTFTFQMERGCGEVVSTWGHYHWLNPHALVHVVEWHTNAACIGKSVTFSVSRSTPNHLELTTATGSRYVFER